MIKCGIKGVVEAGRKVDQICAAYVSSKSDVLYGGVRGVMMRDMTKCYEQNNLRVISGSLTAMSLRRTVTQWEHRKAKDNHRGGEVRP